MLILMAIKSCPEISFPQCEGMALYAPLNELHVPSQYRLGWMAFINNAGSAKLSMMSL